MPHTVLPNATFTPPEKGQIAPLGMRGDYANANADYEVPQHWETYSAADHARWRRLYQQQLQLIEQCAAYPVRDAIFELDCAQAIPDCAHINQQLLAKTGWRLVPVPGLIPWQVFFSHLAARRFPVTIWIREESEFDFVAEPDIFHDFFGHVPLLFNPVFCEALVKFAQKWLEAASLGDVQLMTRIYWYVFEYGLIEDRGHLKAFGAVLLSSCGAMRHALQSQEPYRQKFVLERCMRTEYAADTLQSCYFVISDWEDVIRQLDIAIIPTCLKAMHAPTFKPDEAPPSSLLVALH